jgi:hypothetical protein
VSDRFGFLSAVMEISIHSLLDGATWAIGAVAVIDVFRAFTTAVVAFANGASSIVMVRTVEQALALREAGIGQVCMGGSEAGHRVDSTSATRPSIGSPSFAMGRQSHPTITNRAVSAR